MRALRADDPDQRDELVSDRLVPVDQRRLRLLALKMRWMGLDADAAQMSGVLLQLISAERSQVDPIDTQGES
jgi:hypothetical protein